MGAGGGQRQGSVFACDWIGRGGTAHQTHGILDSRVTTCRFFIIVPFEFHVVFKIKIMFLKSYANSTFILPKKEKEHTPTPDQFFFHETIP